MLTEYETIPEKVKAFEAPVEMTIAAPLDSADVAKGDVVVYFFNGDFKEILSIDEFNKKYRTPVSTLYLSCQRPHADYGLGPLGGGSQVTPAKPYSVSAMRW